MQHGISLVAWWVRWSTEMQRPTTSRFEKLPRQQRAVGDLIGRAVFRPVPRQRDRVVCARVHVLAAEHAAADQAPALGDAELLGDPTQMRAGGAGHLAAQPVELLHHARAAGELGVAQVLGRGRVDAARLLRGRAPGQQQATLADREEAAGAARGGGLRIVDAADQEPGQGSTSSFSCAQPAAAKTSPSPVASTTARARSAKRPDLPWKATAPTRPPSSSGSQAQAWKSTRTPASRGISQQACRISSGSYATE
jgi:hypothetical protein